MTTEAYMVGRKKYARPQGLLLADNPGKIENSKRIPDGQEFSGFIVLSDDNREEIAFSTERIERRERTINGRMRSFHIADKLSITCSWNNLPSRAFGVTPTFDANGKTPNYGDQQYTTDGGAGGVDLLDWYENNQGSFWLYLSYDKYNNFDGDRNRLAEYSQVVEVFFASFDYSVQKRGGSNYDFWNVRFTLEEV